MIVLILFGVIKIELLSYSKHKKHILPNMLISFWFWLISVLIVEVAVKVWKTNIAYVYEN